MESTRGGIRFHTKFWQPLLKFSNNFRQFKIAITAEVHLKISGRGRAPLRNAAMCVRQAGRQIKH